MGDWGRRDTSTTNSVFANLTSTDTQLPGKHKTPTKPPPSTGDPARFLIIGAGSRGKGYAEAIDRATNGVVAAVAEPLKYKREILGKDHIWGPDGQSQEGQSFTDWADFLTYEQERRRKVEAGVENVPQGVDGVFVCVLDEMHRQVVVGLGPLGLHVMCEKPMACSFKGCLDMWTALAPYENDKIFAMGHVLRYSPHNMMLKKLLSEDKVIGDINSVVHTEPVGWWHFTHSYVRGNWRNSHTTGPSLLTKSCHDIDLIAWLLSLPRRPESDRFPQPSTITSTGGLQYFKRSRKPKAAGSATNCMKCALGDSGCKYSAKKVYLANRYKGLATGNTDWPVRVVVPDIEDMQSVEERTAALTAKLEEDYDETTPKSQVSSRNWFGRCVFESDNNVCDDQFVTITWDNEDDGDPPRRATFHMVAQTIRQCDRYSYFYGEHGEIYADSFKIEIRDFESGETKTLHPEIEDLGHGGGDTGLVRQFVTAVDKVKNEEWDAKRAQVEYMGCTLADVVQSHALVFAAEEARVEKKIVDWPSWYANATRDVADKIGT